MRFLVLMIMLSTVCYAGDKGNGGLSIVCRNETNEIVSAELLDIYEGRVLAGRTYQAKESMRFYFDQALERISAVPGFAKIIKEKLEHVQISMSFIPHGNVLLPTDDAKPVVTKRGCTLEQLANFTHEGDIYVSIEIFEKLDNLNKAALLIHEAVYAARREFGDTDSLKSRKVVAELFAEDYRYPVFSRFIRPTRLIPGTYVSDENFCALVIDEHGFSFRYEELRGDNSCSKKLFQLGVTDTKNLLKVLDEESYLLANSADALNINGVHYKLKK